MTLTILRCTGKHRLIILTSITFPWPCIMLSILHTPFSLNIRQTKVEIIKKKFSWNAEKLIFGFSPIPRASLISAQVPECDSIYSHISKARAHKGKARCLPKLLCPLIPVYDSCPILPSGLVWPLFFTPQYIWHFCRQGLGNWPNLWARSGHYFPCVSLSELLDPLLGTSGWFWQLHGEVLCPKIGWLMNTP